MGLARRTKLPQANTSVAKSTSQGTSAEKIDTGVTSNKTAPKPPPTRLIATKARKRSDGVPAHCRRPANPVAI